MEQKITKIALIGKMRSGKDTVGHYLQATKGFGKFAFGTGIKRVVEILYPTLDLRMKPRKLYQDIGQKMREVDPLIWINYLDREVKRYSRSLAVIDLVPDVVITDVRQMNEAEFLKAQGYVLVKIETDEEIRLQRIKDSGDNYTEEDLNHETELAVDTLPYDVLITNNGTVEELNLQVEKLYWDIQKGLVNGNG
ncbi:hypothetical protein BN2127_JRS1_00958 [Bacillus cereus]|nr:hypothetical protein BN2127_JRS1_00958 [Bacillus cereus]